MIVHNHSLPELLPSLEHALKRLGYRVSDIKRVPKGDKAHLWGPLFYRRTQDQALLTWLSEL